MITYDDKLDYLRTAYWMRGYARCLDEMGNNDIDVLKHQLRKASDLLEQVFDERNVEQGEPIQAVTGKQYEVKEFEEFWGAR